MGGKKVRNRMRLKGYIEMEIQKLEDKYAALTKTGQRDDYILGWISALKWVLNAD